MNAASGYRNRKPLSPDVTHGKKTVKISGDDVASLLKHVDMRAEAGTSVKPPRPKKSNFILRNIEGASSVRERGREFVAKCNLRSERAKGWERHSGGPRYVGD